VSEIIIAGEGKRGSSRRNLKGRNGKSRKLYEYNNLKF